MNESLRSLVRQRASDRCEYCHIHQNEEPFLRFHVEHIIAQQHGGSTIEGNLALACHHCNLHKGPNLSRIDPQTKRMSQLFHPRTQSWQDHFRLEADVVVGLTETGRATVQVLAMNPGRSKWLLPR